MIRKRAAIKTLYGNFNFGNKLQNYAVLHNLEKLGFETVTLQYYVKAADNFQKIISSLKMFAKFLLSCLPCVKRWSYKEFLNERDRTKIFKIFSHNYLNISPPIDKRILNQNITDDFDFIFVGSDQVWNENFLDQEDLEFFLGINDHVRVIGLAGSFGVSNISDKYKETYKKGFEKMFSISVREDAGADIIQGLTNRRPEVLVDPVMSLNREEWLEVCEPPGWQLPEAFVLCYFLGEKNYYLEEIKRFADDNNLKVIDIMDKTAPHYVIGPSEFVYLLSKAEYICTDSFHGCVFSLIFNKAFRVFKRIDAKESMSSRITTLLETFDCPYAMSPDMNKLIFNWTSINETINDKKKEFVEFLTTSIN